MPSFMSEKFYQEMNEIETDEIIKCQVLTYPFHLRSFCVKYYK